MQEDFNIYFAAKLAIANSPAKSHLYFVDILDLLHINPMLAYLLWLYVRPFLWANKHQIHSYLNKAE